MKSHTLQHVLASFFSAFMITPSTVHWPNLVEQDINKPAPDQCLPKLNEKVPAVVESRSAKVNGSYPCSWVSTQLYRLDAQIESGGSDTDGSQLSIQSSKEIAIEESKMASAKYVRAKILLQRGKKSEAEEALREAIGLKPDFLEAHFELGVLLARQGAQQYSAAMDQFLEVLRLEPKHADARINLSRLLEKTGDIEASVAELEEAIPFASEKASLYLMLGQKQQKARKYSEAIHSFRLALESNGQLSGAHYGMGLAQRSLGNFAGARSEFESALKLNPQDSLSHYQLGRILEQEDDPSRAIAHLEEARRLQPNLAAAYAELGSLYRRNNKKEEAERALRQAISLNPKLIKACYTLAQLLQARGKTEQANHFFEQVNRLKENQSRLEQAERMNSEGVQLMNSGNLDGALVAFSKALGSCPSLAVAAYNQGVVLARQNRTQEAIESFRTAIQSRPGFALAQYALGLMLRLSGDPAADEQLRKAQLMKKLVQQDQTADGLLITEDPD